jgi:hypothetical protein
MKRILRTITLRLLGGLLAGLAALVVLTMGTVGAQPASGGAYSQDELDQLLAPIALYPDQLLAQTLMSATYPLEVVEAARFMQLNPGLTGDALDQAVADKHWDPSVQSLTAFPQVLAMMNDQLEWMQRLGDAFLVDEQGVMDTVQSLRRRAQAAGNLQATPQQIVVNQDGEIMIEPAEPYVVYVPVYDPLAIYGPWWAPDYLPWFWYPPPIYGYPAGGIVTTIIFGPPCRVRPPHWGWAHPDWHGHRISLDAGNNPFWNRPGHPPPPSGGSWQHAPEHRRGVAYPDAATRQRFLPSDPNAVRARREFRVYEPAPTVPDRARAAPNVARQAPNAAQAAPNIAGPASGPPPQRLTRPPVPSIDPGLSRQQAEANAQRGMQSRQSVGAVPMPSRPPATVAPAARGGAARGR